MNYRSPVPLGVDHDCPISMPFREQTDWLHRRARQSVATGTTSVFVVTEVGGTAVVAYYGWCMAWLDVAAAPSRMRKGAGRYPQPGALLARLGVDTAHEGRGLGAALLRDVVAQLLRLSPEIGCKNCSCTPSRRRLEPSISMFCQISTRVRPTSSISCSS